MADFLMPAHLVKSQRVGLVEISLYSDGSVLIRRLEPSAKFDSMLKLLDGDLECLTVALDAITNDVPSRQPADVDPLDLYQLIVGGARDLRTSIRCVTGRFTEIDVTVDREMFMRLVSGEYEYRMRDVERGHVDVESGVQISVDRRHR